MDIPNYEHTPPGIMVVLDLFRKNKLSYLLFKCEHIFAGENKNVDVLLETEEEYRKAGIVLEQQGFAVRLSEKVEKYKTMYTGFINNTMHSIHLHREIAWHGMIAMDKKEVFKRKKAVSSSIIIPCLEDSILIHAAHVLFENFKVTERERKYFLQADKADKEYLYRQAGRHHWKGGLEAIEKGTIKKLDIVKTWALKLLPEPATALYGGKKVIKKIGRRSFWHRPGTLIALIGVNGTGKTTLAKKTLENYAPSLRHLGSASHYYYFGWEPEFFLTKIISRILQKKEKKIFAAAAINAENKKFYFFQELLLAYNFIEFYYRYQKNIRPKLRQRGVIISDRYFYDIYGQYPYARRSIAMKFLLPLFPKPDYTFLLTAPLEVIQARGKENRQVLAGASGLRKVLPELYLQRQTENYSRLQTQIPLTVLDTSGTIEHCAGRIISDSWRKVL